MRDFALIVLAVRQGQRGVGLDLKHGHTSAFALDRLAVQADGDIAPDHNGILDRNIAIKKSFFRRSRFQVIVAACQNKLIVLCILRSSACIIWSANKQLQFTACLAAAQPLVKGDQGVFRPMAFPVAAAHTAEAVLLLRVRVRRLRRGWQQRQAQGQRHQTAQNSFFHRCPPLVFPARVLSPAGRVVSRRGLPYGSGGRPPGTFTGSRT